ncbi:MAG: hypothetical protein Ta2G_07310 [Termitinemataceae bacterium]|nr:MAG: hypothetical protein Ta2G_07310 [Termitinemataceae bacterium]
MKKIILLSLAGFVISLSVFAQYQLPENGGFHQEGVASWYGTEYQGRPTASGELFDPNQLTAAHRDLPYGTIVTVTNVMNGKQVQVRINDRGPMNPSRIIDVSKAAAERLDMLVTGMAKVSLEVAQRGSGATVSSASPQQSTSEDAPPVSAFQQAVGPAPNPFDTPQSSPPQYNQIEDDGSYSYSYPPTAAEAATPRPASPPAVAAAPPDANAARAQPYMQAEPNPRLPQPTAPQLAAPRQQATAQPQAARNTAAPPSAAAQQRPLSGAAAPNPRLPTATQPAVTPQPRQASQANANRAVPATNVPTIPPSQPVNVAGGNRNSGPAYSAVNPSVTPSAKNQAPSLQPIPSTPRPPVQAPQTNNNVNNYPRANPIPAVPPSGARSYSPAPTFESAEIIGAVKAGKVYRLQIGSYREPANAIKAIEQLSGAGLTAQYEQFGEMYRVVLTNVSYDVLPNIARQIGRAGFDKAVAREER